MSAPEQNICLTAFLLFVVWRLAYKCSRRRTESQTSWRKQMRTLAHATTITFFDLSSDVLKVDVDGTTL